MSNVKGDNARQWFRIQDSAPGADTVEDTSRLETVEERGCYSVASASARVCIVCQHHTGIS